MGDDIEKQLYAATPAAVDIETPSHSSSDSDYARKGGSFLEKFQYYNGKLESAVGIEARGIQRVPEDERHDTKLYGNLTLWMAANCVLPTFGVGILGPLVYGMHLGDSMLTVAFFVLMASAITAFCSTFGPALGLRQMTSARFAWGWYGAKGVATLNCIACVGWSIANTIAGSQTLCAAGEWKFSPAVGTVVIAMCTLVLGVFGYKFLHRYESVAWIPTAITFIVMLAVAAPHLINQPMPVGRAEAASVLSFGGIIWGFCIGWVSLASDYNVYMPKTAPSWRIFMWTYLGITIPCILIMWLGAAIGAAALAGADPALEGSLLAYWYTMYEKEEVGGLVYAVLVKPMGGGGKFFMVLLVLSVIANNVVNVYSMGMSISVISKYLSVIPRIVWPCVITAIYIPLAIVGANKFATTLQDFLGILGYWLGIFSTVVIEEHFIFRKGRFANYHVEESWNDSKRLPIGLGAMGAFCFGVAGAAVGMSQVWYTGPLGKLVGGPFGGDIGFELASGFAAVTYPIFRTLELKFIGR